MKSADRIKKSLDVLSTLSPELSRGRDSIVVHINIIESKLARLGLGVTAWHREDPYFSIGYARAKGGWGILLRNCELPDDAEPWRFNNAPSSLRARAIEWIPALMETLVANAQQTLKDVDKANVKLQEMMQAIEEAENAGPDFKSKPGEL